MTPTDNGNLVKAGQNHLPSTFPSKKSTLASVGRHSTKAGEEKTVAINLIFLQSGTANKLLEIMKEAKLLEEKEEVEVKTQEKVRTRISPKAAMSITTSQEEDSDYSEVDVLCTSIIITNSMNPG